MNKILDFALRYASLGWQVLPILRGQKVPACTHGVLDATIDEAQIRKWWEANPEFGIAVACGPNSGVFVVDIDVSASGDKDGWQSLQEFPPLPETVRQNTPRGGAHFFYRTDDPPVNRINFRPAIDIRSTKTYVLVPPSIHPNGGQYSWSDGMDPWTASIAEFPSFMRPTVKAPWASTVLPPVAPRALTGDVLQRASLYLAQCDPAIQGQGGHDRLLWAAVAMVHGFLLTDSQTLDILIREYNGRCIPPWDLGLPKDDKDFRRKVSEARKLTPQHPSGWLLEDSTYIQQPLIDIDVTKLVGPGVKQQPIIRDVADSKELEFLTHPAGLLGEICEWINTTAIRKQPLLTLACALTFCGVLFGRKVRDSLGTRTNLYCFGVAKSSAGKAHAPNQIRRLTVAAGCGELLGGDDAASDTSIEERIEKNPACLFMWDEIGFLLSYIRSGISQHHVRIVPLLMKLYSAAGSIYKGKEYADSEQQRTIIQPCCCIYGTSSPEQFAPGISPEQLHDGWIARCLIFKTRSRPEKNRDNCDIPVPQSILEQVSAWHTRQINVTDGHDISAFAVYRGSTGVADVQPPEQIVVPRTPEAEKLFISFDNEASEFGRANPFLDCLWSKGEENARRIALILAASESFDSPRITSSIADYACRLIRYLLLSFGQEIAPIIVSCEIDAQKRKLLEIIGSAGIEGCRTRDITRAARWSKKRQRNDLLADLQEAEEVVAQVKKDHKGVHYWTIENYRMYLEQ